MIVPPLMSQDLPSFQDNSNQQASINLNNQGINPTAQASAAAMIRAAQQQSAAAGLGLQQNPVTAAMLQQGGLSAPSPDQQQASLNISNEIKRLQQLHQMTAGVAQAPSNALLMPSSQRQNEASTTAFLQSMLDQQKVQTPRFDNPLGQALVGAGGAANPAMFAQPGLLQDARMLMAQNQLNAAMNVPVFQAQAQQEVPLPSPHSLFHRDGSRRMRGGVIEPFPEKLHRLLLEVEAAGRSDVISFVAGGRAFAIHKPDKFFKEIVPLYFRQSRLSSFKRQLNLYGFELINTGPARGGYYHELFVKDRPEMCRRMRRVAVKVVAKSSDGQKGTTDDKSKVAEGGNNTAATPSSSKDSPKLSHDTGNVAGAQQDSPEVKPESSD